MYGFIRGLAHNIPECHVDATHHMHGGTAAAIIISLVPHGRPDLFVIERIHAGDHFVQSITGAVRHVRFDDSLAHEW